MGFADFTNHKSETQAIIEKHKNDFTSDTVKTYLASKGGYKAYVRSLGGVFAKYADFTGKVTTYQQLAEIGDYVWGLYDIWGVDYSNGCSYVFRENRYKAYAGADSCFYKQEKPVARFAVNYAALSFANGTDVPGIDEMLGNPDKYYAVTNCGQGVVQMLKKAGLCPMTFPDPAEYPEYWRTHGYPYSLIKNTGDLKPGDVLYFFNKKLANRSSITKLNNWHDGGFHTAIVGEMTSDGYILYDSGHAYTYYGEFRNVRKFSEAPYQWAADWIGIRFNFGLKEEQVDISKFNDVQLAQKVWNGELGSGDARKKALGSRYQSVQHLVDLGKDKINEILGKKTDAEKIVVLAAAQIGMDGTLPWALSGYKDEWCSEFVWYCATCLGLTANGKMPKADTCPKAHSFYKAKGQLFKKSQYKPKPGDIAYFGNDGTMHTAIVESFDGKTLVTIDGNQYQNGGNYLTSRVGRCTTNINGSWIWGFANPLNSGMESMTDIHLAIKVLEGTYGSGDARKAYLGDRYAAVQKIVDAELKNASVADAIISLLAQEVLTGYWGSGDNRKNALTDAGYDYAKVQAKVNELVASQNKTKNGWLKENGVWHYYKNNVKLTGWQKLAWAGGTNWFYFTADGTKVTGLQYLEYSAQKSFYFFDDNGAMQTGKINLAVEIEPSGRFKSVTKK